MIRMSEKGAMKGHGVVGLAIVPLVLLACVKRELVRVASAAVVLAALTAGIHAQKALPVIPGEHPSLFGMTTPAGSGRHLPDSDLSGHVSSSLVAHWDFDDGTAYDQVHSGVQGVLVGDAKIVPRDAGCALIVDGRGDRVDFSNPDGYLDPASDFTACVWVRNNSKGGVVIGSQDGNDYWRITYNTGFKKWMTDAKNGAGERSHTEFYDYKTEGVWRHLAIVYRKETGKTYLFLNGVYLKTGFNHVGDLLAAASKNLAIGENVNGIIDDVMLFNRALSEKEILSVYASQSPSYLDSRTDVYRVTNLNDSGPGSLREGIDSQERARVIVFEASGTIVLDSPITLEHHNSYLTIAGQTAPSPGITLKDYGVSIRSVNHDALIQHLRVRPGDKSIGGRLTGWTQVAGTVYSIPLDVQPDTHYRGGSLWYNGVRILEAPDKTKKVGAKTWDWEDRVLYVNVGENPDNGILEYGVSKSAISDPLTISSAYDGDMITSPYNIVIDHNSFTWGGDMNVMSGADRATFTHNLISESLHHPLHPKGPHSKGFYTLSYCKGASGGILTAIVKNMISHSADRNPTISSGYAAVANNFLYDTGPTGAFMTDDTSAGKKGPIKASFVANCVERTDRTRNTRPIQLRSRESPESRIYVSEDNIVDGATITDPWNSVHVGQQHPWPTYAPLPEYKRALTRDDAVWPAGYEPMPAAEVKDYVLANVGARPADRDPVDARIIANVGNRIAHIIASQDDVGGWPDLAENHRALTLPDNPDEIQPSGYTALEEWLHGFAAEVEGR